MQPLIIPRYSLQIKILNILNLYNFVAINFIKSFIKAINNILRFYYNIVM